MANFLHWVNSLVWGAPALVLILGVGLYFSVKTRFLQLRLLPRALGSFVEKLRGTEQKDGVSPVQALCTALAATVGTGNIAGVAGAIALGGPGAIFWMWLCAVFGMITKFAEATLAVRFRVRQGGELVGGPMYVIRQGMGKRWAWLGSLYSFFGVIAAFGVGNATQVNAVITGINSAIVSFGGRESRALNIVLGLILAILVGLMLLGGARRIGSAAELLVPFASVCYLLLCLGILIFRADAIPGAFGAIFRGAFSPGAVTGGLLGSAFQSLRVGVSRGVFTNEAGMGTAAIAHASARVDHPAEQGLMGIVEVFLDTIVICTMTALGILCSGLPIPYGQDTGAELTVQAFSDVYGNWVSLVIAASLCCFAFATILGWGLYGLRCAQFLFGLKAWKLFAAGQTVMVLIGAVLQTGTVWLLAEIVNGLMAIPNLIAIAALRKELLRLIQEYNMIGVKHANGGTYANFYQRKPLRAVSHAEIPPHGGGS